MVQIIEAGAGVEAKYFEIKMGADGYYETWSTVTLGEADSHGDKVIAIILDSVETSELAEWITTETPRGTVENFCTDGEAILILQDYDHKNIDYMRHEIDLHNDCFGV